LRSLSAAQNRFVRVPSYAAGGKLPTLLAQHDVNGDGKLDLTGDQASISSTPAPRRPPPSAGVPFRQE
jgi:hypothetical protein